MSDFIGPLEENFETANARITPGLTIGGMGEVSLPTPENGNLGSGDVPDIADIDDDEEEVKKKKTKKKLEMESTNIYTNFSEFVNESLITERRTSGNAVEDLHFEMDPKTAEDMKIAIGASQGEVTRRKQIEGGEYSLRRFRKEIKYDTTGEDLGVFRPGSYMAATSKLGDGPHKKAVAKIKWNQKKYDQWLEDVASNDGWKNAFDMAQNAKNEPGLIDWVTKKFRDDDAMQRIQWDIEAFAESVVTEGMSKSAIKKAIKVIDQQVEDEVGGDGEPLDNETLQALEQERERLSAMLESVTESINPKSFTIFQIATPAPKSMLAADLRDLFNDKQIKTNFQDDEGYESVVMYNLSKSDIKKIEYNIGDVLIWEYSLGKKKTII
jgi:hypothetical protein